MCQDCVSHLTPAQQDTVALVKANARETGATVEVVDERDEVWGPTDGSVTVIETASSEWDNLKSMWTLYPDGHLVLH